MARPKIGSDVILEIQAHRARGLTLDQIEEQMESDRQEGNLTKPSRNTIYKYMREYDDLDSESKDWDEEFEFHRMGEFGLPWEAASYVLELWTYVLDHSGDGKLRESNTFRNATWWWRVHLADPELEPICVIGIARSFAINEILNERMKFELGQQEIEGLLAYKPWKTDESAEAYDAAVERGSIPGVGWYAGTEKAIAGMSASDAWRKVRLSQVTGLPTTWKRKTEVEL